MLRIKIVKCIANSKHYLDHLAMNLPFMITLKLHLHAIGFSFDVTIGLKTLIVVNYKVNGQLKIGS